MTSRLTAAGLLDCKDLVKSPISELLHHKTAVQSPGSKSSKPNTHVVPEVCVPECVFCLVVLLYARVRMSMYAFALLFTDTHECMFVFAQP